VKEQEVVESLSKGSEEFRKLVEEHHHLEGLLAEIDKKVYLTPEEEVERKKTGWRNLSGILKRTIRRIKTGCIQP
jgi:hypothetical protein